MVNWDLSPEAEADFYYLRYQALLQENKTDQALKSLQKVIAIHPTIPLFLDLANLQWQNNDLDKARSSLKQGLEQFPDSPDLTIFLCNTYVAQKRWESAITTLKNYLKEHKENLSVQRKLASIYLEQQQFAQALDILNKIPDNRQSKQTLFLKSKAYSELGLKNKAIQHLKKATEKDPDFLEAWAELAYLYELEKDYVAAADIYSRLLEMGQTSSEIRIRLIDIHLKLNNPDKALALVKNNKKNQDFLLRAAGLFLQEHFYSQAEEIFSFFKTKPESRDKYYFYQAVLAYEGQNSAEDALNYLQKIKPESDIYPKALGLQARLYSQIENVQKALDLARQGQKEFPEHKEFWLIETSILESQEAYKQARQVLKQALKHRPNDLDLLYRLALIEYQTGAEKKALQLMEKVINIDSEHVEALNFVGYTLAESGKDLQRALVLVKKALKLEPDNGFILDSLAWVYFKQGKIQKAWETIVQAISKVQDDPVIWEHYADIAQKAGFADKAEKGYQKALELDHKDPDQVRKKLKSFSETDQENDNL